MRDEVQDAIERIYERTQWYFQDEARAELRTLVLLGVRMGLEAGVGQLRRRAEIHRRLSRGRSGCQIHDERALLFDEEADDMKTIEPAKVVDRIGSEV